MIKKFDIDEFIEELDEFWSDLQNGKFEISTEELQLAKRIIEQNPGAFKNEEVI